MADQVLSVLLGWLLLFIAYGVKFAKIDKKRLGDYSHKFPHYALYRFPVYRWSIIILCFLGGLVLLASGLGFLK